MSCKPTRNPVCRGEICLVAHSYGGWVGSGGISKNGPSPHVDRPGVVSRIEISPACCQCRT